MACVCSLLLRVCSQIYHTELGNDAQNAAAHALLSTPAPEASGASEDKQHARWTTGMNLLMGDAAVSAAAASSSSSSSKSASKKAPVAPEFVDEPMAVVDAPAPAAATAVPRLRAVLDIRKRVRKGGLTWHAKGDYLCSVSIENAASAVLIHRL